MSWLTVTNAFFKSTKTTRLNIFYLLLYARDELSNLTDTISIVIYDLSLRAKVADQRLNSPSCFDVVENIH